MVDDFGRRGDDAVFGTVVDRMVVQAVCDHPLTVYGSGGQTRGMLDVRDTVECIRIACEHPARPGEFRVFKQFTEELSVRGIAATVKETAGGDVTITTVDNRRVEADEHYYHAAHSGLVELGLEPHLLSDTLVDSLLAIARRHRANTDPSLFDPSVRWRSTSSPVGPHALVLVA